MASVEMFHNPVAWYIYSDVWDVEYHESYVEFVAIQFEIFNKAVDFRIADVTAINES
jgi:hypothetical protein